MAEEKKLDEAAKDAKDKTTSYKCQTKCFWQGILYHEGDILVLTDEAAKNLPEHFKKVE